MSERCLLVRLPAANRLYDVRYVHQAGHHIHQVLTTNFTTQEQVDALFCLGELSRFGSSLDTMVAYHRDLHEPLKRDTASSLAQAVEGTCAATVYQWADGCWLAFHVTEQDELEPLPMPTTYHDLLLAPLA